MEELEDVLTWKASVPSSCNSHQSAPGRKRRTEERLMIRTDSHNYDSAWVCTSAGAVKLENEAFTDSLCKDVGLQEFSCLCETACCCCYSTDNNNLFEWIQ